ncbi:MAG: ATP-binding cassette domain-containing protein, partial [Pseudomonadota bacterium]|nr:ATP-binding cassette domain-containing protein [Pseudomonadota bacterium]
TMAPHQRAAAGIGWVPQERNIFKSLSVDENLTAVAAECETLLARFRLADVMDQPVHSLAYGKRRLLEIALALACRPRVLLLDEPVAGVPEGERQEIFETIDALPADVSILLIEHDMDLVFNFAKTVTVLVNGAIFAEGDVASVSADPRVKAVYLGQSDERDERDAPAARPHG